MRPLRAAQALCRSGRLGWLDGCGVGDGLLALESYKEYIEIFAKSLRESMATREGVAYLLQACGFHVTPEAINLAPETRWKIQR